MHLLITSSDESITEGTIGSDYKFYRNLYNPGGPGIQGVLTLTHHNPKSKRKAKFIAGERLLHAYIRTDGKHEVTITLGKETTLHLFQEHAIALDAVKSLLD